MTLYAARSLSNAVAAICPDIEGRVLRASGRLGERRLWWELSSCILSSQVPYSLAIAFSDVIDAEGVLLTASSDSAGVLQRLVKLLRTPLLVEGRSRSYRFPVARAHHLAAAYSVVTDQKCTLRELVYGFQNVTDARAWFVKHVPGLGPKQASMFLRNAGVSYDLAILDRHVLNYMSELGIYSGRNLFVSGLTQYHRHEAVLREHAQELDCAVGILDWAIWIVMRVAARDREVMTV